MSFRPVIWYRQSRFAVREFPGTFAAEDDAQRQVPAMRRGLSRFSRDAETLEVVILAEPDEAACQPCTSK